MPHKQSGGRTIQIEIQCPFHNKSETLEMPDGYEEFEGEVKCPSTPADSKLVLRIKMVKGQIVSVERSR